MRLVVMIVLLVSILVFLNYDSNEESKVRNYSDFVMQSIYYPIRVLSTRLLGADEHPPQIDTSNPTLNYSSMPLELQIATLQAENQQLKELLEFREQNRFSTVSVRILGQSREVGGHRLFVSGGSADGIYEGSAVFNQDGLIGQVVSVTPNAAWVMTIYDPHSKIPVTLSASRRKAVVGGDASGSKLLPLYYLSNTELQEEIALTSGEGGVFPYGLHVGRVVSYENELWLESSVSWSTLDYALVSIQMQEK